MTCKNNLFFNKRKAFTLIELLIVIAIIGILFIVLVSKVDFATDKAKATGVQTDFRSFQMAIESIAKEHSGLATFGWDTGDANGDRVRNSYDKGDTNKNGVQDDGEVFVGSKTYSETWTNVYTLTNPADANDKSAIIALEEAINKNLDPKLHITIADDLTITMANGAQDPWDTEYHGYYITNATVDNKDRGAIVIYSNGANQEFGSEHSIANGIVTITVPGNNKLGADDYSIAVVYTYANGYGEVKTLTNGFRNNQILLGNNNAAMEEINPFENMNHSIIIPQDGTYIQNKNTYIVGEEFPEIQTGDKYFFGDYEYQYGYHYTSVGWRLSGYDGWGCRLINDVECPGNILSTINNYPLISMSGTFRHTNILNAPIIPNGVINIDNIFERCINLKTYDGIIDDDYNFTNYKLPNTIVTMKYSFLGTAITHAPKLHEGILNVDHAFGYNESLLVAPILPNTITEMEWCFYSCKSLVTYYGNKNNDFSNYYIPNNITSLRYSFGFCESITSLPILNNSVTNLDSAFDGCKSIIDLSNYNIPDSVTNMYQTFMFCSNLKTAPQIPKNVTNMGRTFYSCSKLEGNVIINATPNSYDDCLETSNKGKNITLIGDSLNLLEIASTSTSDSRIVYDKNGNVLKQ